MRIGWLVPVLVLMAAAVVPLSCEETGTDASRTVRVGSKKFTESVILGELARHLVESAGLKAIHQQELGGTRLVFKALRLGEIDVYPEYTGTIRQEILAGQEIEGEEGLREALAERGIVMGPALGFNNTYAVGVKRQIADRLGLTRISDLRNHPDLKLRFSNEFMDRSDGWPGLRDHYGLPQQDVKGMDHDLAYRQLEAGSIDAIDVYTTDAKIAYYDLQVLEDDRGYFPRYDAVFLFRDDLPVRAPGVIAALVRLAGRISETEMIAMNGRTVLDKVPETRVAADFLGEVLSLEVAVTETSRWDRVWRHTREHIDLVRKSLLAAILVAVPLGVLAAKHPATGQVILGSVGIIQTVPALALLVMLIKPVSWVGLSSLGSESATAVVALFLYSLLPIVRNTYTGLHDIPESIRESAVAIGLPALPRLWIIELPMASRTILAGIKTAAVINVGFATLGALIGAGGYGQPILTGIRLDDTGLILEGAVPAAVLALAAQGLFELAEHWLVPKGLRLKHGK